MQRAMRSWHFLFADIHWFNSGSSKSLSNSGHLQFRRDPEIQRQENRGATTPYLCYWRQQLHKHETLWAGSVRHHQVQPMWTPNVCPVWASVQSQSRRLHFSFRSVVKLRCSFLWLLFGCVARAMRIQPPQTPPPETLPKKN